MILRLHVRSHSPHDALAEALGRPVSSNDGLTKYTVVVARWSGLDYFVLDDKQMTWTPPPSGPSTSKSLAWSPRSPPARTTTGGRSSTSTSDFTPTTGS
ncbi:hypothetical protein [Streptomyces sp. IBSNAI001]|uniref:hypothetical protein n=1 Tax=Streptomyces sp. IBSNAI001 TaxID=3457499 RepID=UPI003FD52E0A